MPFEDLFEFERLLAEYTGAPYAVATDGCTHAIELAMRYDEVKRCRFTSYTYLSIPQLMLQLDIDYELVPERWVGEYQFYGTRIWDSARLFSRGMYRPGAIQCMSFGYGKPIHLGKVGAILTDDPNVYYQLSRWRSDGRDLSVSPWRDQATFGKGWHYCPTLEDCERGIRELSKLSSVEYIGPKPAEYPDLRELIIQPGATHLAGRTNRYTVH